MPLFDIPKNRWQNQWAGQHTNMRQNLWGNKQEVAKPSGHTKTVAKPVDNKTQGTKPAGPPKKGGNTRGPNKSSGQQIPAATPAGTKPQWQDQRGQNQPVAKPVRANTYLQYVVCVCWTIDYRTIDYRLSTTSQATVPSLTADASPKQ